MTESCENEDRLSELPIQLKEVILRCLPITDAVKTSVLSSEWRYVWTSLSKLVFDSEFWESEEGSKSEVLTQILLAHNGPIREFYIHVPLFEWSLIARFWLLSLLKKGVENIEIVGLDCSRHLFIPSSMFECLQLKRLKLNMCALRPPLDFRGFPKLVRLSLLCVCIESQVLRDLIHQCPLLETLTIGDEHLSRVKMPIVLNSKSLKTLKLINVYLGSVSFENVPNLTKVSLLATSGYDPRDLQKRRRAWEFMSSLSGIKELSYQFYLLEISESDIIPKKLPELLRNLNKVKLCYVDASSVDQMAFMFCIIKSSPNLQNLKVHMSYVYKYGIRFDKDSLRAVIAYLEVEAKEEIKTSITTVTVSFEWAYNWEHIGAEIALIESIVSCCPVLEKLVIKGSSSVKGYSKLQLSRALRRLGRSSSKPKIIYSKSSED